MSLACFECGEIGSFDTLVVRNFTGDPGESPNFYIHRSHVAMVTDGDSEFSIVTQAEPSFSWNTPAVPVTKARMVDLESLRRAAPKTVAALTKEAE